MYDCACRSRFLDVPSVIDDHDGAPILMSFPVSGIHIRTFSPRFGPSVSRAAQMMDLSPPVIPGMIAAKAYRGTGGRN
jgi:hypothetical protein